MCVLCSMLGCLYAQKIITPILPTVKMLSLGGERLPPAPPPRKKKKKFWIITCTTIWVCYYYYCVFFAHLLILEYPDHHQNLISSSQYYPGPRPKISSQSVHKFLNNVVHKQTNQRHQKHNLLCQGGKSLSNMSVAMLYLIRSREICDQLYLVNSTLTQS